MNTLLFAVSSIELSIGVNFSLKAVMSSAEIKDLFRSHWPFVQFCFRQNLEREQKTERLCRCLPRHLNDVVFDFKQIINRPY